MYLKHLPWHAEAVGGLRCIYGCLVGDLPAGASENEAEDMVSASRGREGIAYVGISSRELPVYA
jgi:hypothetical protein